MPIAAAPGPTYIQSFVGGVGLALPVHALLALNGNVFGISGFLHRAVRGQLEGAVSVLGLVLGGAAVGLIEGAGVGANRVFDTAAPMALVSGFLVGLGTKLGNGCTSGHMVCGVSRLSIRSIVATATFMLTGFLTTRAIHSDDLAPMGQPDLTLGPHGPTFIAGCGLSLVSAVSLSYLLNPRSSLKPRRLLTAFLTSVCFALGLRIANMTSPSRVIGFLVFPPHPSFDPSLISLAVGALPLAALLYHSHVRSSPTTSVPNKKGIDLRLVAGAAIFGVGWGMEGVCPGPALVNFGQALVSGIGLQPVAIWLASFVLGGLLVPS